MRIRGEQDGGEYTKLIEHCSCTGEDILQSPRQVIWGHKIQIALQKQSYFKYTTHSHASAQSLMRELEVIRAEGVAFDREEHELGINSIAAPILTPNGRVVGAMSVVTASSRFDIEALKQFKDPLLETARKIGEEATSWQFPS